MNPFNFALHLYNLPFTGCFGRLEREAAVTYLVLAARRFGWGWTRPQDLGVVIRAEIDREPCRFSWVTNPFFVPDFGDLVKAGFAELDEGRAIRLTPKAFAVLEHRYLPAVGFEAAIGSVEELLERPELRPWW